MKTFKNTFFILFCISFVPYFLIAQESHNEWQCHIVENNTANFNFLAACPNTGNSSSEYGRYFTPKGDLNILIVYAGFVGLENNNRLLDGWGNSISLANTNSNYDLPDYVHYDSLTGKTTLTEMFFSDTTDFLSGGSIDDPNNKSISKLFNLMSKPKENFRITQKKTLG